MKEKTLQNFPFMLLDGGIGSELYKRGVYINKCFEECNITQESLVEQIHKDYVQAGANIITTNTWGANTLKLKSFGLENKLEEINTKAVELAKKAAKEKTLIAGSVGPLGVRIEPFGPTSFEEAKSHFSKQIKALTSAGCDLLVLETYSDLSEIKQALAACKEIAPDLPIIAYLTIANKSTTLLGTPLPWACTQLEDWGADVVGLNCNVGPKVMLDAVLEVKKVLKKPLAVRPNSGSTKSVGGRYIDLCSPEYLAHFTKEYFTAGVKFVGGCCGTGPEHIKMMANALRFSKAYRTDEESFGKTQKGKIEVEDPRTEANPQKVPVDSNWAKKIQNNEKVVCVELLPPQSTNPSLLIKKTKKLKEMGVDAINIPDGPRASARMSALLTAVLIERDAGIETILHYTCRDRNILGIQSDFIGAQAIGLRNMLLITGDPPKTGLYPHATGVFDVDAIGLTNIVNRLNQGIDIGGKALKGETTFSIGVGVNPTAPDFEKEMKRFMWKVKAGASWAITQPVFDLKLFKKFMDTIEERGIKIPIIAGVWPLVSYKNALFLNNEVPGVDIPEPIMKRMKATEGQESPSEVGVQIAKEMMVEIEDLVQGFQLSAPFGKISLIEPLIN